MGNFIGKTIKSLKAEHAIQLHKLKLAWLEAVGPFLGTQTEPVKVSGRILYLIVSSPLWAQEINLQQRLILKKLRGTLGNPPTKIVCWVGEPHSHAQIPQEQEREKDELVPWKAVEIPEKRREKIEATVSTIEEGPLKERMRSLLELSVQREIYLVAQGLLPCPMCGNFRTPEYDICPDCEREKTASQERAISRMLARKPWLTAKDLMDRTPVKDRATFLRVRKQLLANLMLSAWQRTSGLEGVELSRTLDEKLRTLFLDITMLRCTLPAHLLQPKHFYFALGKRLAAGYLNEDKEG